MDKKVQKVMPSREIKVKIGIHSYSIKLPKNGQLIDIEVKKMSLTAGMHKDLALGLPSAVNAAVAVEAACTFSVLLPDLHKDMNVPSILDLDMIQSKPFIKAYEQYYEWMGSWRKFLNDDEEEESKEEDADDK